MVKKLLYFLSVLIVLISIYLTVFELILHTFHSPFNSIIEESTAQNSTWVYLLKQHYITFIELDIFNLHEKRHLLDVKKVFESTYRLWLLSLAFSLLVLIPLIIHKKLKIFSIYLCRTGFTFNILLLILSLNFLNTFTYLHTLLFSKNTWLFPKDSLLIEWFPLRYFQEFFVVFWVLSFLVFLYVKYKKY